MNTPVPGQPGSDAELIERLRQGDEAAFTWLVDTYSGPLLQLAGGFLPNRTLAEEAVQETWLAFLTGINRFEGRAAIKTWLFKILMNQARTLARRENRSIPFSTFEVVPDGSEPAVDPGRFRPLGDRWTGHWANPPTPWSLGPEGSAIDHETLAVLSQSLEELPPAQRIVVSLRDLDGWSSSEVCTALELSEANQRVLLHRGRSRLRRLLESYFTGADPEARQMARMRDGRSTSETTETNR